MELARGLSSGITAATRLSPRRARTLGAALFQFRRAIKVGKIDASDCQNANPTPNKLAPLRLLQNNYSHVPADWLLDLLAWSQWSDRVNSPAQ